MRLYASQLSNPYELRIDVLPEPPADIQLPHPDTSTSQSVMLWEHQQLMINGTPSVLAIELHLASGELTLLNPLDANTRLIVAASREADRLRLAMYTQFLDIWYLAAQDVPVSPRGMSLLEQVQEQVFRLQQAQQEPDPFECRVL